MGVAGEKEVIYKPEVPVNKVHFAIGKFTNKSFLHQKNHAQIEQLRLWVEKMRRRTEITNFDTLSSNPNTKKLRSRLMVG